MITPMSNDFKIAVDQMKEKLAKLTPEEIKESENRAKELENREKEDRRKQIKDQIISKFGARFADCRFDNYVISNDKQKKLVNDCKNYIAMEKTAGESMLMFGKSGTGKTHLLVAMFRDLIYSVEVAGLEFLNAEKMALQKKGKNWMTGLSEYIKCQYLIIPDLIVRKDGLSDSIKELLLYIIDERYNNYKPVVICTNVDVQTMKRAIDYEGTERVSDRLRGMIEKRVYSLDWDSYR